MMETTNESLCIDACYNSLLKKNEELCGDRVEVINTPESMLLVLSDGLGSGVKANILSTLTSKIISTMISRGASIEDTVDTIAHTLPVCKVRGIAYSTFMILHISKDGKGYLVEYDNPPCMLIRDGRHVPFDYEEKTIEGKLVRESRFTAKPGDYFVIVSDGVTQAGMGETLAFGWGCDEVAEFLCGPCGEKLSAPRVIERVLDVAKDLYLGKPGDDTTVSIAHIMTPQTVSLFSGPPKNPEDDSRLVREYMETPGLHVVSGGTSSEILSRELKRPLRVNIDYTDAHIPPTATIDGIDLVTEGVLTLKRAIELVEEYRTRPAVPEMTAELDSGNGAAKLAKMLIEQCTHLKLFIGKAVNTAHQNADFPTELRVKFRLLDDLAESMEKLGRCVEKKYY